MANNPKTLGLDILGREYRVNCPPGAEDDLIRSGRYLNSKMEEIKEVSSQAGKVLATDRIAVIAALNITHQLLSVEGEHKDTLAQIKKLSERVDELLDEDSQLEL